MPPHSEPALPELQRRLIQPEDQGFLYKLYAESHGSDLAALPLPEPQKDQLLRTQFEAQDGQYRATYPKAAFLILEVAGAPIGRISKDVSAQAVHLIDLALLAHWRGRGIGTALLQQEQEEARNLGLPLRLAVLQSNPALALYQRLGFELVEMQGLHATLEWSVL